MQQMMTKGRERDEEKAEKEKGILGLTKRELRQKIWEELEWEAAALESYLEKENKCQLENKIS